jgi:hypothetical protein
MQRHPVPFAIDDHRHEPMLVADLCRQTSGFIFFINLKSPIF